MTGQRVDGENRDLQHRPHHAGADGLQHSADQYENEARTQQANTVSMANTVIETNTISRVEKRRARNAVNGTITPITN